MMPLYSSENGQSKKITQKTIADVGLICNFGQSSFQTFPVVEAQ
jgi:hypothetical protein